jgi:adenylate cyclase
MERRLFFLFLLVCSFAVFRAQATLDLKDWDTERKSIISLNTNWEFYWNKLLGPGDFRADRLLKPDLVLIPGSWNDTRLNGKPLGGTGCATYKLLLKNLPAKDLILDVYSTQTSCRIFINDSLYLETGKPGITKETTTPMNRDASVLLPAGEKEIQLIVQVANFHHRKGGFVHPFEIGLARAVAGQRLMYYILDVAESSALAIIGLFLFALYVFRRKDLSVLYFALFCITLSFRPVIAVNYFLATVFPDISWQLLLKMEYLAVLFPCLFMILFIKKLFPEQLPSWLSRTFSIILGLKIVITLFFPPSVFSWLIPPLLFVITAGVIVFALTIIRAILAKVEGAKLAGLGLITLLCSLLLKVLVYSAILPPVHVLITGMDIAFIFMMSLILGSRFSLQFAKVERLQQTTALQHNEIMRQKEAIEEKNKSIIDSINYAKKIQESLLPTEKYMEKVFGKMKK